MNVIAGMGAAQGAMSLPNHQTQTVGLGQDAAAIARANNVTVEALMQANPQVLHEAFISPGQTLNIPPPTMSPTSFIPFAAETPVQAQCVVPAEMQAAPQTTTSVTTAPVAPEPAGPSPGGGTGVKTEIGVQPLNGTGAIFSSGVESLHGNTTYTGSVRVQNQIGAEAETKAGNTGISVTAQTGTQMAFEVVSPPSVGPLSPEQLAAINPMDPRTLPPGVSVKIDVSQFVGTQFEAQVRHAVVSGGVKFEAGVTYQAQRSADGNSAQVAIGPYEAVEAALGAGFAVGPVTVQVGRTDTLRHNALTMEKLDLSDGTIRSQGVQTVSTLEYVSSSALSIGWEANKLELGIGENSGLQTVTINPDGTRSVVSQLYHGSAVPMTVNRTFNTDGTEQVDKRTYGYTVQVDDNNRQLLHVAMGGSTASAADTSLRSGDTVVVQYTQAQMEQLQTQFAAAHTAAPTRSDIGSTQDFVMEGLDPTMSFAVALVRNGPGTRDSYAFSEMMFMVSDFADGSYNNGSELANPGDAWVTNPGQEARRFEP